ncbi:MAG: hypothetical protein HY906_10665, partial [Deltaproteobacteria bacterium]|nr:hypothetical protein [Deltaproteobacteria bacterium]
MHAITVSPSWLHLLTLAALLLGAHGARGQGLTDYSSHAPPPVALPAAGGSYVDPVFGTTIIRVTDERDGTMCINAYAYWPAFNCDDTRLLIACELPLLYRFDPTTHQLTPDGPMWGSDGPHTDFEGAYWSSSDPDVIFALGGARLWRIDVANRGHAGYTLVKDFAGLFSYSFYLTQLQMSGDDDVFTFHSRDPSSGAKIDAVVYVRSTDETLVYDRQGRTIDETDVDELGRYVMVVGGYADPGFRVWDFRAGTVDWFQWNNFDDGAGGHVEMGRTLFVNGDGWHTGVMVRRYDAMHGAANRHSIVQYFRPDGSLNWSIGDHVSMRNYDETFVVGSTYGGDGTWGAFEKEIYLARTDGSGFVRLAHSRSYGGTGNPDWDYYTEPRAVIDRLGRFIVYTSDLGSSSHTDVMILAIPESLWPNPPSTPDGGVAEDGGAATDGGTGVDAAASADAGARSDGGTRPDGGAASDAPAGEGPGAHAVGGRCGCRAAGPAGGGLRAALLALALVSSLWRRWRRHPPRRPRALTRNRARPPAMRDDHVIGIGRPRPKRTGLEGIKNTCLRAVALTLLVASAAPARAADLLQIQSVQLDRPTLHVLGVQVLVSGDDNRNATIAVRYRPTGGAWRDGPPLHRVLPETVVGFTSAPQLAGSVFDLAPGQSYEIELHVVDPDGLDEVRTVTGTTRPVPRTDPATPRPRPVANVTELRAALAAAAAGDVITLADGTYSGSSFSVSHSGTLDNPIVIRGQSLEGTILDGGGCTGCNVLEVYGSYVHVERLTIRNAERALRFQGSGTTNNVARRLYITDVVHGIGSGTDQADFHYCDNVIEGRLVWPWVFDADATSHWDDRGIYVNGDGHVVCHNRIVGFGDPLIQMKKGARAYDYYGNDISESWDGCEIDGGEGNARVLLNRWTNVSAGLSIQPIYGGPAYVLRNVFYNVVDEQIKYKSLGGTDEPTGALVYHNTWVSPKLALNLQTAVTGHNFVFANNLFVGPAALAGSRTVEWTETVDRGSFDYDGFFPDGGFWLGAVGGQNILAPSFAALQALGMFEQHGALLVQPIFQAGFVGPAGDGRQKVDPPEFALAAGSNAVDRGLLLPGINQGFLGAAPDLGAVE